MKNCHTILKIRPNIKLKCSKVNFYIKAHAQVPIAAPFFFLRCSIEVIEVHEPALCFYVSRIHMKMNLCEHSLNINGHQTTFPVALHR